MKRRNFLKTGSAFGRPLATFSGLCTQIPQDVEHWSPDDVAYIIPIANQDRFLIKVSFHKSVAAPQLKVGKSRPVNDVKRNLRDGAELS